MPLSATSAVYKRAKSLGMTDEQAANLSPRLIIEMGKLLNDDARLVAELKTEKWNRFGVQLACEQAQIHIKADRAAMAKNQPEVDLSGVIAAPAQPEPA